MRTVRRLSLALLLPAAACADAGRSPTGPAPLPSFAASPFTDQVRVPLEGTVFDECAGQLVAFTGTGNLVYHETLTSNGAVFRSHFNAANIKGVGEDGTRYVGSQASNDVLVLHFGNGGVQQSSGITFRITSQGGGDDFLLKGVLHVTIDANGVVTAAVDRFTTVCTG